MENEFKFLMNGEMSQFMKEGQSFSFNEYFALGKEQALATSSPAKRTFFSLFGTLQINPRIRSGRILSEIIKVDLPDDVTILDAGFGYGLTVFALSRKFENWKIVGYELDEEFVNKALKIKNRAKTENVTLFQKNLNDMRDEKVFNLIYSCDVLEHIQEDVAVIHHFKQALKPGGILILHLPLRYELSRRIFPWFKNYDTEDHVRDEYLPNEIRHKLETAGFHVDSIQYGYGLLKGELAFELNNFVNANKIGLVLSQLITFLLSLLLGFWDIKHPPALGNSLVIKASLRGNK